MADGPQPNKVSYIPGLNQTRVYNSDGKLIIQLPGDKSSPGPGEPDYTWAKDTTNNLKPSTGGTNAIAQSGKDFAVDTAAAIPYAVGPEGGLATNLVKAALSGGGSGLLDKLLNPAKSGGDVAGDAVRRTVVQAVLPAIISKGLGAADSIRLDPEQWMPHDTINAEPTTRSGTGGTSITSNNTSTSNTGPIPNAADNPAQAAARAYSQGEIARMQGITVKTPSQGTQIQNAIGKHQAVLDALDEANQVPGTQTVSKGTSQSQMQTNNSGVTQPGQRVITKGSGAFGYPPLLLKNLLQSSPGLSPLQKLLTGLGFNVAGDVGSDLSK